MAGSIAVRATSALSGKPLSGPFQLWNQRTNFGNSGTWTQITCPTPPEEKVTPPAGIDALGNSAK